MNLLGQLGDAAIVVSVVCTMTFIVGYLSLAPWWKSNIGRSLALSKTWIAGIALLAFLRTNLELPLDNWFMVGLRNALWVMLPVISVYQLWALLIDVQIRKANKKGRKEHAGHGSD